MKEIPFLEVSGTHFTCGEQVGSSFRDQINLYLELCRQDPPDNLSWEECIKLTPSFLAPTQKYFPEIIDEISGAAQGAGVDFIELFATSIEELYSRHYHIKNCTDIILLPPANDHTLVLHNNDLPPAFYDTLTSVAWNFDDGTKMFTVGIAGFLTSVGANNSGVVLSGNEVTPTDTKTGIPRSLIARAILLAKTFDEAVNIAINPERASSYNNIITVKGKSVSIEGSATEHELIFPHNGILTHSNHYCSAKMLSFEGRPNYESSIKRLESAQQLSQQLPDTFNLKIGESFLANHGSENIGNDNTICRHGEKSATTFGFAVDLDTGIVELSSGNPCQNKFKKVWQIK